MSQQQQQQQQRRQTIIGLGDQTGGHTYRHVDTRTMRINRANQETTDNLTNRRITGSMVRQDLVQLLSLGGSLFVVTDDG